MADDIATLGIRINSKEIFEATKRLDKLEKQSVKNEKRNKKLGDSFGTIKTAIAAVGVGLLTKKLIGQINTYQNLTNQLKLVTKGSKDLANTQELLFNLAQDTRAPLQGTVELYAKLARSTKSLGLEQTELAGITGTINQAIAVSGASATEANAAILQLGQGLASGVLRGEEYNSIAEQTPRLTQAIADGIGVEIGALRALAAEGKLTSEVVVKALTGQADVIQSEFDATNKTVAQAMLQIENTLLKTFGEIESADLVGSLDDFRDVISDPQVVASLQAIAAGVISVTSALISAIPKLNSFGTAIGKYLSSLTSDSDQSKVKRLLVLVEDRERSIANLLKQDPSNFRDKLLDKATEQLVQYKADILEINQLRKASGLDSASPATPITDGSDIPIGAFNVPEPSGGTGGIDLGDDTKKQEAIEKASQKALERIKTQYATELELLDQKNTDELAVVNERNATGILNDTEHALLKQSIEEEYQARRAEILTGANDSELENIRNIGVTKLELMQVQFDEELAAIDTRLLDERISEEEHADLLAGINKKYAEGRTDLRKTEIDTNLSLVQQGLGAIENLMSTGNARQFKIAKRAAIASSIINTYKAAASGFATDPFFPVGIAMGAFAIANGIAQVRRIKSQQPSGGSAGGGSMSPPSISAATSSGVTTTQPAEPSVQGGTAEATGVEKKISVSFQGDSIHSEAMRKFAEDLAETIEDMGGVGRLSIDSGGR